MDVAHQVLNIPRHKVLFLVGKLGQYPFEQSLMRELFSECLPQEGFDVTFLHLLDFPSDYPKIHWLGTVKVINVPGIVVRGKTTRVLAELLNPLIYAWFFFRTLFTERPAIIQVRQYTVGLLLAFLAGPILSIPVAYHEIYPVEERTQIAFRERQGWVASLQDWSAEMTLRVKRILLRRIDLVQVISETMQSKFSLYGILPEKLFVLPLGVNVESEPFCLPLITGHETDLIEVVYLGTLDPIRSPNVMLQSAAWILAQKQNLRFVFIGGFEQQIEVMRQCAEELGIAEACEFTGLLPRRLALERTRQAQIGLCLVPPIDIFVVSSPTKLVEMMALGLPIIANYGIPEQENLVGHNQAGLLVNWSPREIGEAILRLADDSVLRRDMGHRGRAFVAEYRNYRKMARELALEYDRVIEKCRQKI